MARHLVGDGDLRLGRFTISDERAKAEPLLSRLRDGGCRWEDLSEREREAIAPAALIDYLLEASYACRFDNPGRMVALAHAACAVADGLSPRRYGNQLTMDLRAQAWAELGNSYRTADDLGAAGSALARAQKLASEGTRSASLSARIAENLGSYLSALRDFGDAISLLMDAEALFKKCGDGKGIERVRLTLAHVLTQANEPERAIITYLRVLQKSGPFSVNRIVLVHGLALNMVECGFFDLADVLVKSHLRLYKKSGQLNDLRRIWLEGKIAAGLHDYGRAEGKLQTARLSFLRLGQSYDSALAALDLAWVYARQGRRDQVIWLVNDMLRTFKSKGILREAIASLVLLKKSCEERRSVEALCGQIETLAKLLPELASRKTAGRD